MNHRTLISGAAMLALAGCAVGPTYTQPAIGVPPAFSNAPTAPGATIDPAKWWTAFGDPTLTGLVEKALADNPTIAIAASRVRQARIQEIIARADGKPTLGATANASRVDFSKNAGFSSLARQFSGGGSGNSGGIALPGGGITTYAVGFDASWELDLFGGGRRGVESAAASAEAAIWNRRDAAVTLAAEVADAYLALRLDQAQIALIDQEILRQQRLLQIVGHVADAGLTPGVDAARARGDINETRARLEPIKADIDMRVHALGVLTAQEPDALAATLNQPQGEPIAEAIPIVPVGLPSDLLRRRPDIRVAERQLAAATADIGVAVADLYPKFNLTSMVQLISSSLGNLFTGNSFQFIGSGAVTFPVVDWGRGRANVGLRKEDSEQAYIRYQASVLSALRDVADPLSRIAAEQRRNAVLRNSLTDAERRAHASAAAHKVGLIAQDPVLSAEIRTLAVREQLASSDAQLRQLTVTLFKATGGGWSDNDDHSGAPSDHGAAP